MAYLTDETMRQLARDVARKERGATMQEHYDDEHRQAGLVAQGQESMRTVGDVRAEVDRALRGLDKVSVADLGPLIARVEKLSTGHPDILEDAIERIRRGLPSPLMLPRATHHPSNPYRGGSGPVSPSSIAPSLRRPEVVERPLRHRSNCELAFDQYVPANRKTTITSRPQLVFRGEMLLIPTEECADGDLYEILVGQRPQIQTDGFPRPLSRYCPARWADPELMEKAGLAMDTATVAQDVSLVVIMRKAVRFQALIRGIGAC
jgi:hypothetical protein